MKVHYLEFITDKPRMEKGLKGISEENSLIFYDVSNLSKNFPDFSRSSKTL